MNLETRDIDFDAIQEPDLQTESLTSSKKNEKISSPESESNPNLITGHAHSEISKAKISAANKGKVPWNVGKKHSEETKARIAEKTKEAMLKKRVAKALSEGFSSLDDYEEKKKQDKLALKIEKDKTKVKGLTEAGRKRISDRYTLVLIMLFPDNISALIKLLEETWN